MSALAAAAAGVSARTVEANASPATATAAIIVNCLNVFMTCLLVFRFRFRLLAVCFQPRGVTKGGTERSVLKARPRHAGLRAVANMTSAGTS